MKSAATSWRPDPVIKGVCGACWCMQRVYDIDLLQQDRLVVQYARVNDNAKLLSTEHDVHEVHVLRRMIFRSFDNLQTRYIT